MTAAVGRAILPSPASPDEWLGVMRGWAAKHGPGELPKQKETFDDEVHGIVNLGQYISDRKLEANGKKGTIKRQNDSQKILHRIGEVSLSLHCVVASAERMHAPCIPARVPCACRPWGGLTLTGGRTSEHEPCRPLPPTVGGCGGLVHLSSLCTRC